MSNADSGQTPAMCHLFFGPPRRPRPGPRASPPRPSALARLNTCSNGSRHSFPKHLNSLTRGSRCLGRFPLNQIRHLVATVVRREFGLDAARALLSHKTLGLTDTYAELDLGQASKAVRKLG